MAEVRLADVIDVIAFEDMEPEFYPEKTAFFESGVVVRNDMFDSFALGPATYAELIFWRDLDRSEPNYSCDDPAHIATPKKVAQAKMQARKAFINQGWSAMDLVAELTFGTDPMRHIRNRVDEYFASYFQKRLIATAVGVLNANVNGNFVAGAAIAGVASDMVFDISLETTVGQTAANWFSRTAFVSALGTMGDMMDQFRAIAVHSVVYLTMINNNDIDFIPDSEGNATIPTFLGKRVIVDDSMPVIPGTTSGFRYVSMLFGRAAFAYGRGKSKMPVEIERKADVGNGGGSETLWVRKTWLVHPLGHTNNNAVATNHDCQDLADLEDESNWDRTHSRKNVPFAYLITNK